MIARVVVNQDRTTALQAAQPHGARGVVEDLYTEVPLIRLFAGKCHFDRPIIIGNRATGSAVDGEVSVESLFAHLRDISALHRLLPP